MKSFIYIITLFVAVQVFCSCKKDDISSKVTGKDNNTEFKIDIDTTVSKKDSTIQLFEKCIITLPSSYSIHKGIGDDSEFIQFRSKEQDIVGGAERSFDFKYDTLKEYYSLGANDKYIRDSLSQVIGYISVLSMDAGNFRNCEATFALAEKDYFLRDYIRFSFAENKMSDILELLSTIKKIGR
ncbi:MAG: hypothetical protein MJ197_03470 [Bacteroidales bacterium]|nr:hypothetical protein [Bacteroidales bacterium]